MVRRQASGTDARRGRLGAQGVVAVAAAGLLLAVLFGARASATHEQPTARDIEQACPPDRVTESGFEDIAGNPHEDAIECVAWWGAAQGRQPSAYEPGRQVRRDQMASFIAGKLMVAGVEVPLDAPQAFDDVGEGNVHAAAVNALAQLGVVSGHRDGSYRPAQRVRRDQMASFVSRSAEHTLGETLTDDHARFGDVSGDNPHADSVNGLADAGIVQGRAGDPPAYAPALGVRRDQMASFLSRTLDLLVAEGVATPPRAAQASLVDTAGDPVGQVNFTERAPGRVEVHASVSGLSEGFHGFHLHETGSCGPDFTAAGGHYNPAGTDHGDHAGDLPVLLVGADGTGELRFGTDRVSVEELLANDGTAVIVHEGPDNYANIPERYGGPDEDTLASGDAGGRAACGVVEDSGLAQPPAPPEGDAAAPLVNPDGEEVGVALFTDRGDEVEVSAVVEGLSEGFHGFHLHETGSCEPDFAAAGGHYNPAGSDHGDHAGDLATLFVTGEGVGALRFTTDRVSVEELLADDGTAVIVHEGPDNYANIPERYGGPDEDTLASGDAGGRLACGAVTAEPQG